MNISVVLELLGSRRVCGWVIYTVEMHRRGAGEVRRGRLGCTCGRDEWRGIIEGKVRR